VIIFARLSRATTITLSANHDSSTTTKRMGIS
jgi:hypothetical protein